MKRVICLLLILTLFLSGCFLMPDNSSASATFYYLRAELNYGQSDGVIAGEEADIGTHREDLSYVLALYLNGPVGDHLCSPFPKNVKLVSASVQQDALHVALEGAYDSMEALDITKMCACLGLTCFGISDVNHLSVRLMDPQAGYDKTMEFTRDSLILQDLSE